MTIVEKQCVFFNAIIMIIIYSFFLDNELWNSMGN